MYTFRLGSLGEGAGELPPDLDRPTLGHFLDAMNGEMGMVFRLTEQAWWFRKANSRTVHVCTFPELCEVLAGLAVTWEPIVRTPIPVRSQELRAEREKLVNDLSIDDLLSGLDL